MRFEPEDWRKDILVWVVFVKAMVEILGASSVSPRGWRVKAEEVFLKVKRKPVAVMRPMGPLWDPWMLLISEVELMVE